MDVIGAISTGAGSLILCTCEALRAGVVYASRIGETKEECCDRAWGLGGGEEPAAARGVVRDPTLRVGEAACVMEEAGRAGDIAGWIIAYPGLVSGFLLLCEVAARPSSFDISSSAPEPSRRMPRASSLRFSFKFAVSPFCGKSSRSPASSQMSEYRCRVTNVKVTLQSHNRQPSEHRCRVKMYTVAESQMTEYRCTVINVRTTPCVLQ